MHKANVYILTTAGPQPPAHLVIARDVEEGTLLVTPSEETPEDAPGGNFRDKKIMQLLDRRPTGARFQDTRTASRMLVLGGAYRDDTDTAGLLCGELGRASTVQWFYSAAAATRLESIKQTARPNARRSS